MRNERLKKVQLENEIKRLEIRRRDPSNPLGWTENELQIKQKRDAEVERWARSQPVKEPTPWYIQCIFWFAGLAVFTTCLTACFKACLGSNGLH